MQESAGLVLIIRQGARLNAGSVLAAGSGCWPLLLSRKDTQYIKYYVTIMYVRVYV